VNVEIEGAPGGNVRQPRALLPECAALDVDEPKACGPIESSGVADPVCPRNMLALLDASTRLRDEIMLGEVDASNEAERFLTLLGAAGYRYRTLSLGADGSVALSRIRDRPPLRTASLGAQLDRGIEAGVAQTLATAWGYPLRLGATIRLYQFDKLELGGDDGEVYALTVMPAVVASTELRLTRQVRLEPGAGWGLHLREGVAPATHLMLRHGPEVSLTFVALQRLYAQAGVTWFLDDCAGDNACSRTATRGGADRTRSRRTCGSTGCPSGGASS